VVGRHGAATVVEAEDIPAKPEQIPVRQNDRPKKSFPVQQRAESCVAILDHKGTVGPAGDPGVLRLQITWRRTEERERQMVSASQQRDHLIENQLPARPEAVQDGEPTASKHDMGQANQGTDRHSQGYKGKGSTCHFAPWTYQQTEEKSAEQAP
jgi:hypothetical protein